MLTGRISVLVSVAVLNAGVAYGQAAGGTKAVPATTPTSASTAAPTAGNTSELTNMVQPATAKLQYALSILTPERWKVSKAVKGATAGNVSSIQKDVEATLPPLLASADAAPNSLTAELPLARNLAALYDVLLRVVVVGETGAPQEQMAALAAARTSLEDVRRSLDTRIQSAAEAQESQVAGLKKQLAAQTAAAATAAANPPPCKPAPAAKSKKKKAATT